MNRLSQPVRAGESALHYQEINEDLVGRHRCDFMEFRLVYEGQLPSGNNPKPDAQHAIRKCLHSQLKTLWNEHPALSCYRKSVIDVENDTDQSWGLRQILAEGMPLNLTLESLGRRTYHDYLADAFQRCNHRFVPLVHKKLDLVCEIDVLFLRRSNPGELIKHGGDLDNRMKTLFDALKIPDTCAGLPIPNKPARGENPFYCLLQDDSLITVVNITTDKLMTPKKPNANEHDVCLILNVKVKAAVVNSLNLPLA